MKSVPFLPALFGFVLVLPFIYTSLALAGLVTPPRAYWADPYALLNSYGAIYLALLGGVYWGFAAKRPNVLDVLIALVPPFAALGASFYQHPVLPYAIGIAALLVFDILYIARGMAPRWWLSLRVYSGIVAVGALVYAYYA